MRSMSNPDQSDDSLLKRYLALQALRDNILYTNPIADTAGGLVEDIPGPLRAIGAPLGDTASSLAVISNNPDKRRLQIANAADKVRAAASDRGEMKDQMLTNAGRLAAVAAPAGAAIGGLLSIIGGGKGMAKRLALLRTPTERLASGTLNRAGLYKKILTRDALTGGVESGLLGGAAGAAGGLNAGTAKPGEEDLQAAAKIIQDHPYASSIPGAELTSILNSYGDGISPEKGSAIGLGLGAAVGASNTFLPPTIKAISRTLGNAVGSKPKAVNLLDWYRRAAKGPMTRNALILGGLGGLAGYTVSKHTDHKDA